MPLLNSGSGQMWEWQAWRPLPDGDAEPIWLPLAEIGGGDITLSMGHMIEIEMRNELHYAVDPRCPIILKTSYPYIESALETR